MSTLSTHLTVHGRVDSPIVPGGAHAVEPRSFGEWITAVSAFESTPSKRNELANPQAAGVGKPSDICQPPDASSEIERDAKEEEMDVFSSDDERSQPGTKQNNTRDYDILASILAACTTREKPKVYRDCESAGLPLRELDRLAQALHDSATAGSPKLSLGVVVPLLGEIRFDVRIAGKVVFIHAFVENERAASALALAVSALRERLEKQRLILGRLDVTSPGQRTIQTRDTDKMREAQCR